MYIHALMIMISMIVLLQRVKGSLPKSLRNYVGLLNRIRVTKLEIPSDKGGTTSFFLQDLTLLIL